MKMSLLPFSLSILKPLVLLLVILSLLGCGSGMCIERERLALLDFKKSFVSALPGDFLSYWQSSDEDCCDMDWGLGGVFCDSSSHVVTINLSNQLLKSDKLRPSLLELQHLEQLILNTNDFSMKIPEFIGSFSKLTLLEFSGAGFYGKIPPHLGNLSNLQSLYLSDNNLFSDKLEWLSNLGALKTLSLSSANISEARDWLYTINKLPLLSSFGCSFCSLPPPLLPLTDGHHVNLSTSLQTLDLSGNPLSPSTLLLLMNITSNLSSLWLTDMYWEVPFPDIFHSMNTLEELHISGNYIEGGLFKSVGNLSNLSTLYASNCRLNQTIVGVVEALTSFANSSLEVLSLMGNNFTGTIPPMLKFPSLQTLDLSNNRFKSFPPHKDSMMPTFGFMNHSIQQTVAVTFFPSSLSTLDLSSNSLEGVFSDAYIYNLSNLYHLDLSDNPNLRISFIKPIPDLRYIFLRSCNLGPDFPSWLVKQFYLMLDISSCNISGSIPVMFWENLPPFFKLLNFSFNNFHDSLPNIPYDTDMDWARIDLRSNRFHGAIPFPLLEANMLLLSQNNFSSITINPHPNESPRPFRLLTSFYVFRIANIVDLSDNCLSGVLPHWFWVLTTKIGSLNLANNNFSGSIPSSIGGLSPLNVLVLYNNSFSGELPLWLGNCTQLYILDLSRNSFSGFLPSWIGEKLTNMVFLSLGSNRLVGTLPTPLFLLSSLQVIDLSNNTLSGIIPSSVQKLTAMVHDDELILDVWEFHGGVYTKTPLIEASFYRAFIKWKGISRLFEKNLHMVKLIDLSSNSLSGEIPEGFTSLSGLNSLDLSNNHLNGSIPKQIGQLRSLEVLNLCNNRLGGEIPSSLANIFSLDVLNVSHNNLSGKIPTSTQLQSFDPSAYAGNPELCGLPLPVNCHEEPLAPLPPPTDANEMRFDVQSFCAAMGFGFAFGFLAVLATLSFIATWRRAFFGFAAGFVDWLVVTVALSSSRISKKLHFG